MQVYHEPRGFMYADFLHHPGLTNIQYKTFFHMCRLEGISFDMESRSGSTFCLFDSLSSGVIGMLTIGVHRRSAISYMTNALSFIQNQVSNNPLTSELLLSRLALYPQKPPTKTNDKTTFPSSMWSQG